MIEKMLDGIDVKLGCDYLENKQELDKLWIRLSTPTQ